MLNLETESKCFESGYKFVGGVDEAGRGPLAGPVVAACVVIDANFKIDSADLELINDSKKLSAKNREKLFGIIKEKALAVEIGIVDNLTIDKSARLLRELRSGTCASHRLTRDARRASPMRSANLAATTLQYLKNKIP